jgi:ABC-2 type transport system ATP-binding protein
MANGIEVRGLSRRLGAVQAVADFDLVIGAGEIVGLLGPNGAGKTSTIEAIAGLAEPDAGVITICGIDARADPRGAKRRTGVVLQATGLQDQISPREAIALFAALQGVWADANDLLARFGLKEKADAAFATLSGGQQQRLALALAFIGRPGALLLDEPTAGLDPQMRREIHDHIRAARDEGAAILLATHDMDEAARLCDRVAILDRGRIVAEGPPSALIAGAQDSVQAVIRMDRAPDGGWPTSLPHAEALTPDGANLRFVTRDLNASLGALLANLDAQGIQLLSVQAGSATLEDVILRLTGASAD